MGMPSISITFTELASTAIARGEKGIIALILKDTVPAENPIVCASEQDIPATLSAENKEQIALALKGYVNAPKRVIAYVEAKEAKNYDKALKYFKTVKFDYLVVPTVETDGQATSIVSYVKAEREANKMIKAVLPNQVADFEGIINFATPSLFVDGKEYTTEKYCSRVAGIIAGTPASISATYAPLPEVTDCTRLTKTEADNAVNAGKFIVWYDGEKVKTGRAVNSLTTTTDSKGAQFQKIKIVDVLDMISTDIRMTAEDNYIGKYANTYGNKGLLIAAIGNYFDGLIRENVLSKASIDIDIDANRAYLKGKGIDVDSMADNEIKSADTGSFVFLKCKLSILDAIEDIVLPITI